MAGKWVDKKGRINNWSKTSRRNEWKKTNEEAKVHVDLYGRRRRQRRMSRRRHRECLSLGLNPLSRICLSGVGRII
jgi:hypothetical protein